MTNLQLEAWKGEFGEAYIQRNPRNEQQQKARDWSEIFSHFVDEFPQSILEVGPNVGKNLAAIKKVCHAELFGVEPNETARKVLVDDNVLEADHIFDGHAGSLPFEDNSVDMAFTSGVLIHIDPDNLLQACSEMYRVSKKYILCNEYFLNERFTPGGQMVKVLGEDNLLFMRDFGSFWMDNFKDLKLLDYGFLWRRVSAFDSTNWWLFEKTGTPLR